MTNYTKYTRKGRIFFRWFISETIGRIGIKFCNLGRQAIVVRYSGENSILIPIGQV